MRIETERLILQPLTVDDLDAQHALWSQEIVYRHILGKPMDRETAWLRLLRDIGHWQVFGFGMWSVRLKETDRHIGVTGIFDARRDIDPPMDAFETGWIFDGNFHGQGFASEALKAALVHADDVLNLTKTQCIIAPENAASLKLALKHGYSVTGETLFHGEPTLMLERLRPAA